MQNVQQIKHKLKKVMKYIHVVHSRNVGKVITRSTYFSSRKKADNCLAREIRLNEGQNEMIDTSFYGKEKYGELASKNIVEFVKYDTKDVEHGRPIHIEVMIEKIKLCDW
ncbi:MAG: hypothetical protein JKY96_00120 [Phycisphaerales bacterium]|nr:hypothetical protein [Phycisphaerales bacterium]